MYIPWTQKQIEEYEEKEKSNQDKQTREMLKHQESFSGGYSSNTESYRDY